MHLHAHVCPVYMLHNIIYSIIYTFLSRYGNLELNMSFSMTNLLQGAITEEKLSATHVVYGPPPPFPEGWKTCFSVYFDTI